MNTIVKPMLTELWNKCLAVLKNIYICIVKCESSFLNVETALWPPLQKTKTKKTGPLCLFLTSNWISWSSSEEEVCSEVSDYEACHNNYVIKVMSVLEPDIYIGQLILLTRYWRIRASLLVYIISEYMLFSIGIGPKNPVILQVLVHISYSVAHCVYTRTSPTF